MTISSDITFITNEPDKSLRDRFAILLEDGTRNFDCLVGYFFISGFYKLYSFLEKVEKIRILVGIQTDTAAYEFIQKTKEQEELPLQSHAMVQERVSKDVLGELEYLLTAPRSRRASTNSLSGSVQANLKSRLILQATFTPKST